MVTIPGFGKKNKAQLTIVIPAYNEEESIGDVLKQLAGLREDISARVIVVDDGSADRTAAIAQEAGVDVIRHPRNKGYGAALKSGIREADTEYVLTMDADGQYRAVDIVKLWEVAGDYDMVSGRRTQLLHSTLWRMPGKWLLMWMANYLTKQKIPDLNSGLRLFRTDVIKKYLHICPMGFSFSTTSMMALLSRGYNVGFVPVEVLKRTGRSTVKLSTGFETIILILRITALFNPLRMFVPLSALSLTFGTLWGSYYVIHLKGLSTGALLAMFTGVLMFSLGIICDQISQLRLERFE
jgi:glycosyltransferase involved in cell wall biosynthesis